MVRSTTGAGCLTFSPGFITYHVCQLLLLCFTWYYGMFTSWEIDGETVVTVSDFIFGAPKSLQMMTAAMKLKDAYSLEGKL